MSAAVANRPYIYVHCGHADLDSASHVSRFPPAGTKSALSSVNMSEGIAIQHPLGSPPHTEESSPTVQASYSASDSYTGLRDDLETEAVDLGLKPSLSTNTSGFYASNATVDRDLGLLHSPGVNSDINFSDIQSPLDALAGQGFGRRAGMYSAVSDCSEGTYGGDANQGPAASTDHLTPAASIHGGGKPDVKAEGSGTALYAAEEGSARRFSSFRKKLNLPRESYNAEEEDTQNIQLNLERWAAEERQRRKALRSSRSNSILGSQRASLGRRISTLGRAKEASNTNSLLRMSHGGESVSSLDSTNDKANGHISSGSQFGVEKGEHIARRQLGSEAHHAGTDIKGKGRATDNPFSDPSDPEYESTLSRSASSNKPRPTAHHPIVTIGGTPVVRRHLGHRIGPDGQELPSIVSTDADATGKYDMKRGGASYGKLARKPGTITEDVEEDRHAAIDGDAGAGAAIARQIGERAPPSRKSTADSRFNEIDLEDNTEEEEDSHPHGHSEEQGAVTPRQVQLGTGQGRGRHGQLHSRPAGAHEEGRRVAWWTEWLFCCGGPPPDDEQTGRTNPLE